MSKYKSIQWNPSAERFLSPIQRDAVERGEIPRRLEGRVKSDADGNVWFTAGEVCKLVGSGAVPTLADGAPAHESAATRELDAPPEKSAKRKRKAKRK